MTTDRASDITPVQRKRLLRNMRAGNTLRTAALAAGILEPVFREAVERGRREPDSAHGRLLRDLTAARAAFLEELRRQPPSAARRFQLGRLARDPLPQMQQCPRAIEIDAREP